MATRPSGDRSKRRAIPAAIPQNKVRFAQIIPLANLSPHPSDGLIMRPGRSIRGRFAGVVKRDRRAVAAHGCNTHTQRAEVQAARSRCHELGATSLFGDAAVTPRQAARCRRGSQRWLENSDHRGTCGVNLKHRARDAGEKADLRFRHYPDGDLGRDRRSASVSRDIEARGSAGPPASCAPSDLFRRRIGRHDPGAIVPRERWRLA
jgi:hypothetical protein